MRSAIALLLLAPALSAAELVPPSPMPDLVRIIDREGGEVSITPFDFDVILASDASHPGIPNQGIGTGHISIATYQPDGSLYLIVDRLPYSGRWTQNDNIAGSSRITLYVIADGEVLSVDGFDREFAWSEYRLAAGCDPRVEDCRR